MNRKNKWAEKYTTTYQMDTKLVRILIEGAAIPKKSHQFRANRTLKDDSLKLMNESIKLK